MAVRFAGAFLAVEVDFFVVVLTGVTALSVVLVVVFFDVDFDGVDVVVVDVLVRLAVDLLAVARAGADFLVAVDRVAVDFFAVDFLAAALAGVDLVVVDFAALDFAAVLRVVDFFAVEVAAAAVARPVVPVAAAGFVSRPSFLAPDTTFLNSCPGRNFGAVDFFTLMDWPVAGLRPVRAARCTFSKEPKPVMVTFSPLETER